MLFTRLRGRLREVDDASFDRYISRLSSDPDEIQELTNRVTTNETYCYRTPRVWDYFLDTFLPEFQERDGDRTMRVWSAAASTGEEAHTIGVLLEEARRTQSGFDYSVFGTDVSSRVLDTAEVGSYRGRSVAHLKKEQPDLFTKYMVGSEENGYEVKSQIKERIKFKLHNLLNPLEKSGQFDVVFLRNVLIYFTNEDQEKILNHVRERIRPDGVLFIGESETLKHIDTGFEQVMPIIYRPDSMVQRPST